MKILVACEESQIITIELRKRGHKAYSCDILPCSGGHPEWHIQDDVLRHLGDGWDMMIAHPPCTHLSSAGAQYWREKQKDGRQQQAIDFVSSIANSKIPKIAIENPVGILSTVWRKPDQIIHPYQFGDPYFKKTCLWLINLPILKPMNQVKPLYHWCSNSYRGGLRKDGTRPKSKLPIRKPWDNATERSKTFPGIAKAIAEQWTK